MNCAWKELLSILPPDLRQDVDQKGRSGLQEIRMRLGQAVRLQCMEGNYELSHRAGNEDFKYVINAASQYSPWTASTIASGYLTAAGGHRIGLCGQALIRNGRMDGIGTISSMNIRIARDLEGISGNLGSKRGSILILGPPGSGKTTLLRDLIRRRSARETVAVMDERGEIFPTEAGFDRGIHTDVLLGCSKTEGIPMILRTMNPDCIAVDEITAECDCDALIRAGWCGVALLATAHAFGSEDLKRRPAYAPLAASGLFDTIVVMRKDKSWYTERLAV